MQEFNGLVLKSTGSWYTVLLESGKTVECRMRGSFRMQGIKNTNPVAVGDKIIVTLEEDQSKGLIEKIIPRKNYIIRKATNLSKKTHIIAANLDQALLLATFSNPRTSTGFIDRFLITAEAYSIPCVIIFNKSDLYSADEKLEADKLISLYNSLGYHSYLISSLEKEGVELVKNILKDKTTLISGHSGVGKSTLVNAVEPGLNLKVGDISEVHYKGTHTTTFAEMFNLSFGGFIIDTPGIKEFGIVDLQESEISHYFPEMRKRLNDCRFDNCIHINEPGCAVKKAVDENAIAESRYVNYLNILASLDKPDYRD